MADDAPERFRRALGARADTVHLVTYRTDVGPVEGMTATAITALSLAPPALLACINQSARARDAIRARGQFGVSIVAATELEIARAAGHPGGNKAIGDALEDDGDPSRTPVLRSALASMQCRVVEEHDLYTHTVFVADVTETSLGPAGDPLLHFLGGYVTVGPLPKPR